MGEKGESAGKNPAANNPTTPNLAEKDLPNNEKLPVSSSTSPASAADSFRDEIFSAKTSTQPKFNPKDISQKITEFIMPMLEGFQLPPINSTLYRDAVVEPTVKAERQYSQIPDQARKADLIGLEAKAIDIRMHHQDYLVDLPVDARRALLGDALGDSADPECTRISNIAGNKYWDDVLSKGGKLLDPNSTDAAEKELWKKQIEIFAYLGSMLCKDDNPLLHPEQIDRYNPVAKYRPLDEPLPPPGDFNHHLPEKFSTKLFLDKDGKPREFNPREICEREMFSILQGDMKSDLDPQERAVLALHREVLEQVLPWWVLANEKFAKEMDKMPGNTFANAMTVQNNILQKYETEFQRFENQITKIQQNPNFGENTWRETWNGYQRQAMAEIPSTAQAKHFLTAQEANNFTDEQKKQRCWDTRNQNDAELVRESIKLAEWRYLTALQFAVNNGVLFPQAQETIKGAQLPSPTLTHLRAVRSGTNANEFRNPSVVYDLPRHWATQQLRKELNQPMAYPSVLGTDNTIVAPNGRQVKIATDKQIDKQVADNLKTWNEYGYPWPLVYLNYKDPGNPNKIIANTNNQPYRSQHDALQWFSVLDCAENNNYRQTFINLRNSNTDFSQAALDKQIKLEAMMRNNNKQAVCACSSELRQGVDPFKSYNPNQDPLLQTWQSVVNRNP